MGSGDVSTFGQALAADDSQHDALVTVGDIDLVAGVQLHATAVGHKALCFSQPDGIQRTLTLRLAVVQIVTVQAAIALHGGQICLADTVIAVFHGGEQLFLALFQFTHGWFPP